MRIADIRREYSFSGLRREDLCPDPIDQFNLWFEQVAGAKRSGRIRKVLISCYKRLLLIAGVEAQDINAMTLATVDSSGQPSTRIVLLKGVDLRGFIFYSNYDSRKGHELQGNPSAALDFYWPEQERQVCVAGRVSKLQRNESESYFHSRPRGSQIGAWASRQSSIVKDRAELELAWANYEKQFPSEVPMPPTWGGYVLAPHRVEFWQGRPNRLHDRFQYTLEQTGAWRIDRLSP